MHWLGRPRRGRAPHLPSRVRAWQMCQVVSRAMNRISLAALLLAALESLADNPGRPGALSPAGSRSASSCLKVFNSSGLELLV